MKIQMTHTENIVSFDDISCHLELDEEHINATRSLEEAFVA